MILPAADGSHRDPDRDYPAIAQRDRPPCVEVEGFGTEETTRSFSVLHGPRSEINNPNATPRRADSRKRRSLAEVRPVTSGRRDAVSSPRLAARPYALDGAHFRDDLIVTKTPAATEPRRPCRMRGRADAAEQMAMRVMTPRFSCGGSVPYDGFTLQDVAPPEVSLSTVM